MTGSERNTKQIPYVKAENMRQDFYGMSLNYIKAIKQFFL